MRATKTTYSHSHSDKQIYINFFRNEVLKHYNSSYIKFLKLPQKRRLFLALQVIPTTAKVVSKAFKIPIESLCRRKRQLELEENLQTSMKKTVCPFTNHHAYLLTTNTNLFQTKYFAK